MRCAIIGFVLGILWLQQQAQLMSWAQCLMLIGIFGLLLFAAKVVKRFDTFGHIYRLTLGALAGFIWATVFAIQALSQPLATEIAERDITLVGVITGLPNATQFGHRFIFSPEAVLTSGVSIQQIPKKIAVSWNGAWGENLATLQSQQSGLQAGQRWRLTMRLRQPHGLSNPYGFDYEVWLLEQGIRATGTVKNSKPAKTQNNQPSSALLTNERLTPFVFSVNNAIELSRQKLRERIIKALPNQPYAPVIVALVIGQQSAISQQDWTIFARTGVSHLISISGLHVTMLAGMVASLMYFLWRTSFFTNAQLPLRIPAQKVAVLSGFLMALIYVALAGFGVPAQRTLIMLSVVAAALWLNRNTSPSTILCLALAAVLMNDPWAVLWPGFWLSFGAVGFIFFCHVGRVKMQSASDVDHLTPEQLAIFIASKNTSIYSPPPKRSLWQAFRYQIKQYGQQSTSTQYVVTLGLVPLTMLLFNQVSLVSPIANALAIPLVSLIVTPFALLGAIIPAPLDVWILSATHYLLELLVIFLTWLSHFEWAVWRAPRPTTWMFAFAFIGTCWLLAPSGLPMRWAGLLLWLPLCLQPASTPKQGQFTVTALDVGQGMALLIETHQHRLLYDTGPSYGAQSDAGSRIIYPYLKTRGITYLDGLVISHNDNDHSGGALSLMDNMAFGWISSSLKNETKIVQRAAQIATYSRCQAGQSWTWDDVHFEMLHPVEVIYSSTKYKPNAKSCSLKITQGKQSILLAGDIEAVQEDQLINRIPEKLPADVLLAPHHGSGTSSTLPFLKAVNPRMAIFQMGYMNRYKHPKDTVWQRYGDLGIQRLRNDYSGAITLTFSDTIQIDEYRQTERRYWHQQFLGRDVE